MLSFLSQNWDKLLTILFAFLSAIFAGLSFIVLWKDYLRNNPKVVVKMSRSFIGFGPKLVDYITCRITNSGRRKINIERFYFLFKDKRTLILMRNLFFVPGYPELPQTIDETEKLEFSVPLEDLKEATKKVQSKLIALCFEDTKGKTYSYRIKKRSWRILFN